MNLDFEFATDIWIFAGFTLYFLVHMCHKNRQLTTKPERSGVATVPSYNAHVAANC